MSFWERLRTYVDRGPSVLAEPFALLPAETFHDVLRKTLDPIFAEAGFRPTGRNRWTRDRIPHVRDMIRLHALKGVSYSAAWGLSLDFAPHLTASGGVAWHRTAKSAVFDLVYDPLDYEGDTTSFAVSRFDMAAELPEDVRLLAERLVPAARAFFEPLRSLANIRSAYAAKESRPYVRFGAEHYPQERMARAFLLAKMGLLADAHAALGHFVQTYTPAPAVAAALADLLDRTA